MNPTENDKVPGTILDANGQPSYRPTVILSADEARMLREHKRFKQTHGIREADFCANCSGPFQAYVRTDEIAFVCKCRMLYYRGMTP